jgi:hypothetical protein
VIAWLGRYGPAGGVAQAEDTVRRARPQIVLQGAWRVSLEPFKSLPEVPPHDR